MDTHKRLLSILHIVYGSLHILLFLLGALLVNTFLPFIMAEIAEADADAAMITELAINFVRALFFILLFLIPLPSVIGGFALLNGKKWGLNWLMASGCLSLINVPLGTGLGIYTIWVFVEVQNAKKNND
ncbi:hypothetical protein [Marinoscillum furvescens]|uniref:Uncharacterized protein n=1 Tax=Marinoscillum furvescens DSM 4134 TaxID=1122208 RepID=A0A3D9L7L6_MARFU|nr:hypothetical protein [Marinoscillum furvescens]REE02072.1 hypothetical protein C7460_10292 [Marinoscillum furvescens DSM 4134]